MSKFFERKYNGWIQLTSHEIQPISVISSLFEFEAFPNGFLLLECIDFRSHFWPCKPVTKKHLSPSTLRVALSWPQDRYFHSPHSWKVCSTLTAFQFASVTGLASIQTRTQVKFNPTNDGSSNGALARAACNPFAHWRWFIELDWHTEVRDYQPRNDPRVNSAATEQMNVKKRDLRLLVITIVEWTVAAATCSEHRSFRSKQQNNY